MLVLIKQIATNAYKTFLLGTTHWYL